MKKLALLLSVALLTACGGGNSTPTGSTSSQAVNGPTSTVTFDIKEPAAKTYATRTSTVTTTTMRRVIVTNPTVPALSGIKWYAAGGDYKASLTSPGFSLPVADGYQVEVLDYDVTVTAFSNYSFGARNIPASSETTKPYTLKFYKNQTFNVTATPGPVSVVLAAVGTPTLTPPPANITTVLSGSATFDVSATIPANSAYDTTWSVSGGYAPSSRATISSGTTPTITVASPSPVFNNGVRLADYYLAGQFYLKPSLLLAGEMASDFVVTAPAAAKSTLNLTSTSVTF
jgi:hypothetical protein